VHRRIDLARRTLAALPQLVALRPDSPTTVADRIEELARAQPEHPFVVFGGDAEGAPLRTLSYGQLDAAANRVAAWALDRPLRPGSVVALLMENRPEYLVMWAGLAKAGITTALVNTHLSGAALRHAFAAAGTDTLIVGPECLDRFATTSQDLELPLDVWVGGSEGLETPVPQGAHDLDAQLAQRPTTPPDPRVREERSCGDDLFYIYTSGTTGLPKAARFSHRRFLGVGVGAAIVLRLDRDDVHYCALPLYHSAGGVMMVSTVLAAGATLALRRYFSASAFWDDCRRFGATSFQYIGEFCRYLVNQPPREDDRDHRVRVAVGNGLRADVWKRFQDRFGIGEIIEFYGLTEGNLFFMNQGGPVGAVGRIPFGELGRRLSPSRLVRVDVATGEPLRDARGRCVECGVDEAGELLGRIPSANERFSLPFEGYTSAEATRKKILRDVFAPGDSWFRTGDLLRRDRDGWFYFVDRLGDTFRWKGENVSTQEVTRALGEFPGITLVTVYGVEVEGQEGRAGMAALALEDRDAFDPRAFYAFVREQLPAYAAPLFVRLCEELSVTGTFKLRKVDLVEEGFDTSRISDPLFFRDDEAGTYVPLTKKLRREILSGERRV
jgi:fatty-acyl-CoA synthase